MPSKYHILLLWQSDLVKESREVRKFFKDFNKKTAKKKYSVTFELIDHCVDADLPNRPNVATPLELMTENRQTLGLVVFVAGTHVPNPTGEQKEITQHIVTLLAEIESQQPFVQQRWIVQSEAPPGDTADALVKAHVEALQLPHEMATTAGNTEAIGFRDAEQFKEILPDVLITALAEEANPWVGAAGEEASAKATGNLEASRRDKMRSLAALGHDPWGQRFDNRQAIADIRACESEIQGTDQGARGPKARAAGRIMLQRSAGKLLFVDIKDRTGNIQLLIGRKQIGEENWAVAQLLDLGDIIGVDGTLGKTKTGELTIFAEKLHFLTKSLEPPPEKHHGIHDPELRQRMRYLDLLHTDGVLDTFLARTKVVQTIRQTLADDGYLEIEGPTLHSIAGGAAARPFTTHHNALDMELYLRIALELHLKRLLVGGMERVYELGRVYRNEGISPKHNPEFTMLEVYQAYGNYETMMDLTENLVVNAIDAITTGSGERKLPWGESEIDFTPPFARRTYAELFEEHAGVAADDEAGVKKLAEQIGFETTGKHPDVIKNEVFEEKVEDALTGPIFVMDYPASICPLTKRKADEPHIAERFEMFIQGMEIANAYTELNDPDLQEELFKTQLAGMAEEDSMAKMDTDFIRALRHGMPPAGGLGVGIDRLVMLLTNSQTIREVILFPLLRHEAT